VNNPISQIERTKDAYAGNIQGLQKRANVSKELIDLLAMQDLQADLQAARRNQIMQMQGNPATVKDQLQQGLMAEYRQKTARDMGMMPSEGQAIARAQQAMPQGMPQQQMAQGIPSQMGPVKLAGGGIVAFNEGSKDQGPVKVPEGLGSDELADFLRGIVQGKGLTAMEQAKEFKRLMAEQGFDPLGRPIIEEEKPVSTGTTRRRARAPIPTEEPEQGGLASIASAPTRGTTVTRPAGLTNEQYAEQQRRNREGIIGAANQRKKEEYESSLQGQLDAVKSSGIMSGVTPYKLGQEQRTQAEAELALDPDKRGLAAIERIRELSKMEDNEKLLKDMQARVQATYDETAPSRMEEFSELLGAISRGGVGAAGRRGAEQIKEARDRRRQLDQDIMGIQATTIELNRNFGADAARAYAEAEANVIAQNQNARTFLQNAEQAEVSSVMEKARLTMEEQRNVQQVYSEQERNRLLEEQITAGNARTIYTGILGSLNDFSKLRSEIEESVRLTERYAKLQTLDPIDDAREIELLKGQLASEVAALTADIDADVRKLRVRLLEANNVLMPSQDSEQVTLSGESQAAIARAGG
jgi:hypothetical protein